MEIKGPGQKIVKIGQKLIKIGQKLVRNPEIIPNLHMVYERPMLGYLPIVTESNILSALDKVHDQYGEVVSVNMGPSKRMVVIGDFEALNKVFKSDLSTARPPEMMWFNEEFRFGNGSDARGLIFSVGKEWSEQRRFALRRLRDLGLGKIKIFM